MKNIGYHTRLYSDNTQKICGGSFGGNVSPETVARLVKSHFDVTVKNSGTVVFVDKSGREVTLYITVDPANTDIGIAAKKEWLKKAHATNEADEAKRSLINSLMNELLDDDIIQRLSK
jgi:hypothetical protein